MSIRRYESIECSMDGFYGLAAEQGARLAGETRPAGCRVLIETAGGRTGHRLPALASLSSFLGYQGHPLALSMTHRMCFRVTGPFS